MKKAILFLLLLVSANSFAQIHRVAVYDFCTPSSLTPAITPGTENGDFVKTTNTIFKNGQTNISFKAGSQPIGSEYVTIIRNDQTSYYLRVTATTTMTFGCNEDSKLDSIRISDLSIIGDLHLAEGQPGYQDPYRSYKFWKSDEGKSTTNVSFFNSAQASQLQQIYVYYTTPSETLVPSSNISTGSVLDSFGSLVLTFDTPVYQASSSKLTMSNGTSSQDLNVSVSGKVVRITPANKVEDDGTYTITIPAKTFKNSEGFENKALTYTFTVKAPKNTFTFSSVTPAEGTYQKLPLEFTLHYDNAIGGVENTDFYVTKNGEDFCALTVEKTAEKTVTLKMSNLENEITEKGVYKIIIPEKTIFNLMKGNTSRERYNPAFTLTYVIDDSETMKLAKDLINASGLGFPAENSTARQALVALVNAENTPTDEQLQVAIDNFYKEGNVTLPTTGKYYHIAAVNNSGKRLYLYYNNNAVSLTTNKNEATAFYATNNGDGTLSFQTPSDDKYLHVLTNINDVYDGTSSKNVTDDVTSNVKNLTWSKFTNEEVEAQKVFGLFSFQGSLGKGGDGVEVSTYASVDFTKQKVNSTPGSTTLLFTENVSTAFELEETSKPADAIKTVETAYSITPDIVSDNQQTLTLTFPKVAKISLADDANIYFTSQSSSTVIAKAQLTANGDNAFTVALNNLSKGKYALVLKEGAFHYMLDGNEVKTQTIRYTFEIGKNGSGEDAGINYDLSRFKLIPSNDVIKDTDFNDFCICVHKSNITDLVADPNMEVRIARYDNNATIRSGRLVKSTRDDMPDYYILKLVFDNPIQEGELRKDDYAVVLLAGTFGDANFGQYLQDKTSISPSLCHANDRETYTYTVDNDAVTGIDEITTDSDKPSVIYDLMGRRVQNMSRPGIYIVNGKKVVKK